MTNMNEIAYLLAQQFTRLLIVSNHMFNTPASLTRTRTFIVRIYIPMCVRVRMHVWNYVGRKIFQYLYK